jgi:hypothetical protein
MEPLIPAWGYLLKTFSCTARAPWSRHNGQVGESRAINLILPLSALNCLLSGSSVLSRVIIPLDWSSHLILSTFESSQSQSITFSAGLPFNFATTWRTSPKHHLPFGFLIEHRQLPRFFSVWIFSIMVD